MDVTNSGQLTVEQFREYLTKESTGNMRKVVALFSSMARPKEDGAAATVSFVEVSDAVHHCFCFC